MSNDTRESIELAYLILQNKYLKLRTKKISENEILTSINDIFPEDWTIKYDIQSRIEILGKALKENKDIKDIIEKNMIK